MPGALVLARRQARKARSTRSTRWSPGGATGQTGAGSHLDHHVAHQHRLADRGQQPFGQVTGRVEVGVELSHQEPVTVEAGDHRMVACRCQHPDSDFFEHQVADVVPVLGVHIVEPVQVDVHHARATLLAMRQVERAEQFGAVDARARSRSDRWG